MIILLDDRNVKEKIFRVIKKGDILLSSEGLSILHLISPSPIKHISIYFGENLRSFITSVVNYLKNSDKYETMKETINILEGRSTKVIDTERYILEIHISGFRIRTFEEFLSHKKELYIYETIYLSKRERYLFADLYLFFIDKDYSIRPTPNSTYCFESIFFLLYMMGHQPIIKYLNKVSFRNFMNFNSLSITNSDLFKLKLIYKFGLLKITQ